MIWAKQLTLLSTFTIESRVLQILNYLNNPANNFDCVVKNFDATGYLGGSLAKECDYQVSVKTDLRRLIKIFEEDGQVFDMDLSLSAINSGYKILIIRGTTVEILGFGSEIPDVVTGDYINLDIGLFNY